jgi:hypothetical protein
MLPKTPIPKKIMFIVHTETIGGKGVYDMYEEMKKVGHSVKIIAIPNIYYGKNIADIDISFTNKFDPNDVIYPCGQKAPYEKCESINQYKADYIFIQNPYDTFKGSILEAYFMNDSLRKIAKKLMFVVYGPHLFHQHTINDTNLPNLVDTVFVDSESTKDIYINYYSFPKDRIVVSGYQTYKLTRDRVAKAQKHQQETILWLPRWVLSFKGRMQCEGGSTFLNYHYFFYNYAKDNPHINFIIRPHLLLFSNSVEKSHLNQNDLDEIFEKFKSLKNVTISMHTNRSLVDDIIVSDIVISDGTSALGEVVVADKPIIYLSNGCNIEFTSNKLSRALEKYIYLAYDPSDILQYLDYIRENRYKPFQEPECTTNIECKLLRIKDKIFGNILKRDDFKKILDPVENPAEFIAKHLLYKGV